MALSVAAALLALLDRQALYVPLPRPASLEQIIFTVLLIMMMCKFHSMVSPYVVLIVPVR